jgi:hypothetical protein
MWRLSASSTPPVACMCRGRCCGPDSVLQLLIPPIVLTPRVETHADQRAAGQDKSRLTLTRDPMAPAMIVRHHGQPLPSPTTMPMRADHACAPPPPTSEQRRTRRSTSRPGRREHAEAYLRPGLAHRQARPCPGATWGLVFRCTRLSVGWLPRRQRAAHAEAPRFSWILLCMSLLPGASPINRYADRVFPAHHS